MGILLIITVEIEMKTERLYLGRGVTAEKNIDGVINII